MRRKDSAMDKIYNYKDYIDSLKCSDYFLAESIKYNCIEIGDMFFNIQSSYLLSRLYKNMIPENQAVLKYIFQIDDKYKVCQRHQKLDPKIYSGLARIKYLRSGF